MKDVRGVAVALRVVKQTWQGWRDTLNEYRVLSGTVPLIQLDPQSPPHHHSLHFKEQHKKGYQPHQYTVTHTPYTNDLHYHMPDQYPTTFTTNPPYGVQLGIKPATKAGLPGLKMMLVIRQYIMLPIVEFFLFCTLMPQCFHLNLFPIGWTFVKNLWNNESIS